MAANAPERRLISVEQLVLDEINPRFAKPLSQDQMLAHLAAMTKNLELAEHIAI